MIESLIQIIETQLGWGAGVNWSNKDFETLSESIFSKTGKQLSVTTLKRLWGRANYTTSPSISTLDILAEFAGFESWRNFVAQHSIVTSRKEKNFTFFYQYRKIILIIAGALILLAFTINYLPNFINNNTDNIKKSEPDGIEFEFEKVTVGLPNTVIFRYDIGKRPFEKLQIQQSWDESKRIALDEPKGLVTATYYSPGYYSTKLVLDSQIIKKKDLYIPSNGWQGVLYGNSMRYLKNSEILQDSMIHFNKDLLKEMNNAEKTAELWLFNLNKNPQINSANFQLDADFKFTFPIEKSVCKPMLFLIVGTKEVLRFNFSIPGCVGDLMFFLNGEMISGRNYDLSGFGIQPNKWTHFKVVNKANHLVAYVNGKKAFEHQLSSDIGEIGGVDLAFEGVGEIRRVVFTNSNEKVVLQE